MIKKLLYIERVPSSYREPFAAKVINIISRLGLPEEAAHWLMAVMNVETMGTFSPSIQNPIKVNNGNATGLIQFIPSTAAGLLYGSKYNTLADSKSGFPIGNQAIEVFKKMSAVEQLEFVYKYLYPDRKKIKSFRDMYLTVFFPNYVGKPDNTVFPSWVIKSNPLIDIDKNKVATIEEFGKAILKHLPANLEVSNPEAALAFNSKIQNTNRTGATQAGVGGWLMLAAAAGAIAWYFSPKTPSDSLKSLNA